MSRAQVHRGDVVIFVHSVRDPQAEAKRDQSIPVEKRGEPIYTTKESPAIVTGVLDFHDDHSVQYSDEAHLPAVNLITLDPAAKLSELDGPDWHHAFKRIHAVKHASHESMLDAPANFYLVAEAESAETITGAKSAGLRLRERKKREAEEQAAARAEASQPKPKAPPATATGQEAKGPGAQAPNGSDTGQGQGAGT